MQDGATPPLQQDYSATEKFLSDYKIPFKYETDGKGGKKIWINSDVNLSKKGLKSLPDLSMVNILGNFDISGNHLENLKGLPYIVIGDIDASGNRLTSLEGSPNVAFGDFRVQYNNLTNLEGGPKKVSGNYWAQHNPIETLQGGPTNVDADFFVYDSKLTSIEGAPEVKRLFHPGSELHAAGPYTPPLQQAQQPGSGEKTAMNGMVNLDDRVIPVEDEQKPAKSKFAGNSSVAKQLTAAELNARLNIEGFDESKVKVKVKEAWQDGQDTRIKLANGDMVEFARDSDGYARISLPPDQPNDVTTMMAMAELARAKGWKEINVRGGEEFRALSFFALSNAGLAMKDPPEAAVLEQYRERFEQTLATGVDPKTAERQAEKDLAAKADAPVGASSKSSEPAVKTAAPEADTKPRPVVKAPAMRR